MTITPTTPQRLDSEDYMGLLVHELNQPIEGEQIMEPKIRTPKRRRICDDFMAPQRTPSGHPSRDRR